MDRIIFKAALVCLLLASAVPAKRIYFTVDGNAGSTSIEPGFSFNAFWTGLGMGKNQHIYAACCDQFQSQPSYYGSTPKKGNACVAEWNPYTGRMKSCGTVKKASTGAGNWMVNESQEKIHTHLLSMADGKIWMGTHDNDGSDTVGVAGYYPGIFYRGSHLMYVDVNNGDTLVDHSPNLKYYYKPESMTPTLMTKGLPPSDTSGVAFQWHSIMILGINPWCPRYLWTEQLPGVANTPRIVVWDLQTDSTRMLGTGGGSQRELMVDRQGNAWWVNGGTALKMSPNGQSKIAGRGLTLGHSMTYSRTYDSAFTITGSSGEVNLYDFVNDTVRQIANLPDGSNNYRTLATSADGKKLYTIATSSGSVYEFTIATGAYTSVANISSDLSGMWYATGNMCVDTLGNLYSGLHNGNVNAACLLQVYLGKDKIRPLDIPTVTDIEKDALAGMMHGSLDLVAAPNPFNGATRLVVKSLSQKGALDLKIYDANGRLTTDLSESARSLRSGKVFTVGFDASRLPGGVYFAVLTAGGRQAVKKMMLLR